MFYVKLEMIQLAQQWLAGTLRSVKMSPSRARFYARLLGMGVLSTSFLLGACANVETIADLPKPVAELQSQSTPGGGQLLPIEAYLFVGDRTDEPILLEIARTPEQQALGLMNRDRETLPDNQGMLFPFQTPRPAQFWMKNVRFSLDMLFVRRGQIKAIATDVPPCIIEPCPIYGPDTPVDGVIELAGGQAAALNLQPGDRVTIELLENPIQANQ